MKESDLYYIRHMINTTYMQRFYHLPFAQIISNIIQKDEDEIRWAYHKIDTWCRENEGSMRKNDLMFAQMIRQTYTDTRYKIWPDEKVIENVHKTCRISFYKKEDAQKFVLDMAAARECLNFDVFIPEDVPEIKIALKHIGMNKYIIDQLGVVGDLYEENADKYSDLQFMYVKMLTTAKHLRCDGHVNDCPFLRSKVWKPF